MIYQIFKMQKMVNLKNLYLLFIVAIATIAYFVYQTIFKDKTTNNSGFDIHYSTSFFIRKKEYKYALFIDDSKQILS